MRFIEIYLNFSLLAKKTLTTNYFINNHKQILILLHTEVKSSVFIGR